MTIKDKREYIKTALRDYMNNKRQLEQLVIPGLGGVDYARPSVVSDKYSNSAENSYIQYIDRKVVNEKKIEIVRRTLEHYKIEDKKYDAKGKYQYIINRWVRRFPYRKAAWSVNISERTAMYWAEEIYYIAEIIAEEYKLFP